MDEEDVHLQGGFNATSAYECVQNKISRISSALLLSDLDHILLDLASFGSRHLFALNHICLSIKLDRVSKIVTSPQRVLKTHPSDHECIAHENKAHHQHRNRSFAPVGNVSRRIKQYTVESIKKQAAHGHGI